MKTANHFKFSTCFLVLLHIQYFQSSFIESEFKPLGSQHNSTVGKRKNCNESPGSYMQSYLGTARAKVEQRSVVGQMELNYQALMWMMAGLSDGDWARWGLAKQRSWSLIPSECTYPWPHPIPWEQKPGHLRGSSLFASAFLQSDLRFHFPDSTFNLICNPYPITHSRFPASISASIACAASQDAAESPNRKTRVPTERHQKNLISYSLSWTRHR